VDYYSRRAGEYDAGGPHDPLAPLTRALEAALDAFAPAGRVLEIACGTGNWTGRLRAHADEVTALDASPEMLELARRKLGPGVTFVRADLFQWEPVGSYDVVAFFFWLSHVPRARFDAFWERVARCLRASGRIFFADEGRHSYWFEEFVDEGDGVVLRRLRDGSVHRAVKVFWSPEELEERLERLGWDVTVRSTGAFYWGEGRRGRGVAPR
jgi:SAM-dependent methyltransferase